MNTQNIRHRIAILKQLDASHAWVQKCIQRWESKLLDSITPQFDANELLEVRSETKSDKLNLVKRIFAACPDVSCGSIAHALNISINAVKALSNGRRIGKRVSDYSKDEIMQLANCGEILW